VASENRLVSSLLELLIAVPLVAATAVGIATAARHAPIIRGWNERGVKPWACDLCMSFWMTLVVAAAGAWWAPWFIGAWMPAFALAYASLTRLTPMPDGGDFAGIPDEPPTTSPSADEEPPTG
jgi:hypothetical protein